ncbi:phosphotransferase family protein [Umezawaea tangerina]|uniref:Aminoglycoside phosphotransferase (APT) family kinase protein n=1 Tax=Umezawaea tangerina TaxID=84725 RepID=A0A2T0SV51_9PSEU|nr:aminoglycoside phosphotransferase family protein [Umezawaea tangerina]PRY37292.1 aminoglycoside phosphotransferase (APT) family kinase protein [Umezawaea tangerina]
MTTVPADTTIRHVLERACPGLRVDSVHRLDAGHTSKQWVAATDEGRLLVKIPQRDRDPAHFHRLVATTRLAAAHDIPVVRYRTLIPHDPDADGPVLVQEFHEGDAAGDVWESLDEDRRKILCRDLGELVGRVHGIRGSHFGDPQGDGPATLPESVDAELTALLGRTDVLDDTVRTTVMAAVARLDPAASTPALVHGDLWLPNFLVSNGRVTCVLDFEHATYADRFRDFGKLDEHIFDGFPAGRGVFLDAYTDACPVPDDWEQRTDLAHVLHAATMHVYFQRWSPQWAPQYAQQVKEWLARNA